MSVTSKPVSEAASAARPGPAAVRGNDWRQVAAPAPAAFRPALPISVVVPCFEAPGALALTLAGLEGQDYPRALFEVVVVDDGSRPPLRVPASTALSVRTVRQERRGFGAARARNTGARAALHDILVFLDGDVIAETGLLAAHARWHHAVSDALTLGFCAGVSVEGMDPAAVRDRRASLTDLFACRPFDAPWLERHMARTADLTSGHDDVFRAVDSGNLGISRVFFEEVGGFDESFARYGGEDTELGYRVQMRGGLLVPARIARILWIGGRFREPVVGLLGADAIPGFGLGRQDEARVAQQAVGDQLRGPLPALRVAVAPPRMMLQRTGQDHARQRGLDVIGVGVRHPLGSVANILAVAGQGLAGCVGADRQP